MRIVFDGRVFRHRAFSGVENYASNIFEALKTKASISLREPSSENKYLQQFWEHTRLPASLSRHDLLFCPANIAPLWLPKKTRSVLTLHDVAYKSFPESFSKAFAVYYAFLVPRNIQRAERIITVSEASRQEIVRYYPQAAHKIRVIHLGIHEKYRVLPGVKKQKKILYVGSINERKNVTGVIEAFERLPDVLGYELVIVGNIFGTFSLSDKTEEILQRAVANNKIVFKKGLDDDALMREYNMASCFIFPSFYEGFGLPPLEAMACGTPVITSNLSSMPEVCGDAALYVDPYDIEDMAQRMRHLIEDRSLQDELIVKGLEHIKAFTWEKAAIKHLKVFEEALSDQRSV